MKKMFDMLPKTATCRTATFDMLLRHVAGVDGALVLKRPLSKYKSPKCIQKYEKMRTVTALKQVAYHVPMCR